MFSVKDLVLEVVEMNRFNGPPCSGDSGVSGLLFVFHFEGVAPLPYLFFGALDLTVARSSGVASFGCLQPNALIVSQRRRQQRTYQLHFFTSV